MEREFDMDLITTAPSVVYEVEMRDGTVIPVENPSKMPDPSRINEIREPIVTTVNLFMPSEYVGSVMTLCTQKRGVQIAMHYHSRQVKLTYDIPMAEVVMDFLTNSNPPRAATRRWIMSSKNTAPPMWLRSIY